MYIELKNINKSFGDFQASKDENFAIEKGKLVGLLGPSGSGKTTILRMLAGLEHQDSGDICINGNVVNDLPSSQRGIGFVFQNFNLLPRQSALDNVALPLQYAKVPIKKRKQKAKEMLEMVDLADRVSFKPTQLSGGQKQRVAIARAMVADPKILLADEPTGALDSKSGLQVMELFDTLHKQGVTIIMITHSDEIASYADRVVKIIDGELYEGDAQPVTGGDEHE